VTLYIPVYTRVQRTLDLGRYSDLGYVYLEWPPIWYDAALIGVSFQRVRSRLDCVYLMVSR
jgi:hypothetical protein